MKYMHIPTIILSSIEVKRTLLQNERLLLKIESAVNVIVDSLCKGGKLHFCGNGGSAADAQHLAAELSGRFYIDREPLNAEALHCNTSYLTAVANDYGYEYIYSRLLKGTGKRGDVLVGLSTSGNSENMIKAFETAKEMEIITIALTGEEGGQLKNLSDILINIPSNCTPRIQECHTLVGHIICEGVEEKLFKK
ncbi:MAG: SIS domain-containing protein [Bacteroidales bacterium]